MAAHATVTSTDPEKHGYSFTGLNTWKVGFWTFMASECLFFGTLIGTYMTYKGQSIAGPYPAETLDIPLTSLSTFVLLMSSVAMVLALEGVIKNKRKLAIGGFIGVILLGAIFLGFQAYEFVEFAHYGLLIPTNLFGSTFFVLTGFHGAHVTVGVVWLTILFVRYLQGKLTSADALQVEIAGLYWHFVDIVWIVIFTLVYLIQW